MIPTDSASLRANTLILAAMNSTKPIRVYCGFITNPTGRRLGATIHGTRLIKHLPRRVFEVDASMDVDRLQGMIEDAWVGLRRDYELADKKAPREACVPDRRHGWRRTVRGDCANKETA